MVVTKYALEIVVDDEVWQRNYGEFENLSDCATDIQDSMASVVAELVNDWLKATGNEGGVRKIIRKG